MPKDEGECELVEGWFSEFVSWSYVYGEVNRFGTDGVADFLDDPLCSCCNVLIYCIYYVNNKGHVPMVSISRASILWNPLASSFS